MKAVKCEICKGTGYYWLRDGSGHVYGIQFCCVDNRGCKINKKGE